MGPLAILNEVPMTRIAPRGEDLALAKIFSQLECNVFWERSPMALTTFQGLLAILVVLIRGMAQLCHIEQGPKGGIEYTE